MPEIVYVFSNPAMPDIIKIGMTSRDDVQQRLDELYNSHTGVPLPFTCLCKVVVANASVVEKALHAAFDVDRVNPKREFFYTKPERVIALLKAFALPDQSAAVQAEVASSVSPEEMQAAFRAEIKRACKKTYSFSVVEIPIGAEFVYAEDQTKTCKVVDDRHVEYEGAQYSLTSLAVKLRKESGYTAEVVPGARYFYYEGESLSERRFRMESEKANRKMSASD